jgi:hypothetical protein
MARPTKLPFGDYLTGSGDRELDRAVRRTWCGQAHLAVGPACCSSCEFWGYTRVRRNDAGNVVGTEERKSGCLRFFELTGQHGPGVPGHAWACRYYEKKREEG